MQKGYYLSEGKEEEEQEKEEKPDFLVLQKSMEKWETPTTPAIKLKQKKFKAIFFPKKERRKQFRFLNDRWDVVLILLLTLSILWKINAVIMQANILHDRFIFDNLFGFSNQLGTETLNTLIENAPPLKQFVLGIFFAITDVCEGIIWAGPVLYFIKKLYKKSGWV